MRLNQIAHQFRPFNEHFANNAMFKYAAFICFLSNFFNFSCYVSSATYNDFFVYSFSAVYIV